MKTNHVVTSHSTRFDPVKDSPSRNELKRGYGQEAETEELVQDMPNREEQPYDNLIN